MTLPKDILPQVTAGELDAFSTIGGEERLIAFVNRFRELERERIIKLLESKLCSCLDLPDDQTFADREELMKHMNCDWQAMQIEYHVALIKGEQK